MLDFLLNNSITIIFLVTMTVIGYSEYKKYLRNKNLTPKEFRSTLRTSLNRVGAEVWSKILTAAIVAAIISVVSFRELFLPDVFHTVFLTMLLVRPVYNKIHDILK